MLGYNIKEYDISASEINISESELNMKLMLSDNVLSIYDLNLYNHNHVYMELKDVTDLCNILHIHNKTEDNETGSINSKIIEMISNGLWQGAQLLLPFIIGNKSYSTSPYISYTDLINNNDNYTDDSIACIDPLYVSIVHSDNVFKYLEDILLNDLPESPIDALYKYNYIIGVISSTVINKDHSIIVKERLTSIMSKYINNDLLLSYYIPLCMTAFDYLVAMTKLYVIKFRLSNEVNNIYFKHNPVFKMDTIMSEMYTMQKYFAQFDNTDIDSISLDEIYKIGIHNTKSDIASKKFIIWSLDKHNRFNINLFIKDNVDRGVIDIESILFYIYTRISLLNNVNENILKVFDLKVSGAELNLGYIQDEFIKTVKDIENRIAFLKDEYYDIVKIN